jgi:hypothetical protein
MMVGQTSSGDKETIMPITIKDVKECGEGKDLTREKIENFILNNPAEKYGFMGTINDLLHINQQNGYEAPDKLMLLSVCLNLLPKFYDLDRILLGETNIYLTDRILTERLLYNITRCIHSLNHSKKYSKKRYSYELIINSEDI